MVDMHSESPQQKTVLIIMSCDHIHFLCYQTGIINAQTNVYPWSFLINFNVIFIVFVNYNRSKNVKEIKQQQPIVLVI